MIRNIIFDIGGVLASFDWQRYLRNIGIDGGAYDVISDKIFHDAWERLDQYALDKEETRRCLHKAAGAYPEEVDRLCDRIYEISSPYEYSAEWLRGLKAKGYKVYLLSNFGKFPFETLLPKYDFVGLADGRVVSYEIQRAKPDRFIYQYLMDKYGLIPAESVFIDDRAENIRAAVRLGMNGIVFTEFEETEKKLNDLLDREAIFYGTGCP